MTVAAISLFFAIALYTTNGCGGSSSPSAPTNDATLQGTVTSAPNTPVANATVALRQGSASRSIVTGPSGQYRADGLRTGAVNISVTAAGFAPFSADTTLVAGMNPYDIRLQPSP